MLSNDLLSYSIMLNGEKAVAHTIPHYAPLANPKLQRISLPPITSYVSLTENNLNLLNSYLHKQPVAGSTPPSLTLLSLSLELPLASPRMATSNFTDDCRNYTNKSSPVSSRALSMTNGTGSPQKKRRQRLGPSCDNCRLRKVKCNSDVVMISRHFTGDLDSSNKDENRNIEELSLLSPFQIKPLLAGEPMQIDLRYVLVLFNQKLIKYSPCMSCGSKGLACSFSKGFTKEGIIHSKRHCKADDETSPKSDRRPIVKVQRRQLLDSSSACGSQGRLSTRKSSCGACRKRKIKCVITSSHKKCLGCAKIGILCTL